MSADKNREGNSESDKLALVCDGNAQRQKAAIDILGDLGYNVKIASSPEDVYDKLKYDPYEVVYLHENFGGGSSENNEVLDYIQSMPISARRRMFVALAGAKYTVLNQRVAFSESVNVVINDKDVLNMKTVLQKAITGNNMFYKVYNDMLRESGKA
ncbi:MAG: hypothetical protein L7F77_11945 [Candidatus Magnetominusculus sp. LBB02]|nr:hypothetical protein [Candidatus Magnetominusculus sp. LBB02]